MSRKRGFMAVPPNANATGFKSHGDKEEEKRGTGDADKVVENTFVGCHPCWRNGKPVSIP